MDKHKIHQNRKENWETPPEIFEPLNNYYKFELDLAADEINHKLPNWIGPGGNYQDFLEVTPNFCKGFSCCWINPPYGAYLLKFTTKIRQLAQAGVDIVALLPGSIDTGWFWNNVHPSTSLICGKRGRIQFLPRGKSGNPGPSILAIYNLQHLGEPPGWHAL